MNKKRNFQDEQHNQQKNMRKGNKSHQEKNKAHQPEPNNPHDRDMDDGNGEILGGKI
ncbi:MAG: hypothetical protein HF314_03935 [Ignavibacteria bacterium]|jgi:hypothetical protein|nr:hypothetical protein [Ignavibacteria bacterium]MCU7502202.1 hypothetical protein [Ignavibacteria bacterium]MCU7517419.1 hypothetical protein [Ignavibacteria bacterium]